jgi:CheY-like chemotaxis protein
MNQSPAPIGAKQVLYVEDHPVNVLLMEALFERRPGYALSIAVDGKDALRVGATLQPSLLLLDLRLPDCHGAELLQRLRQTFGWHAVPAIAVTAEPAFKTAGTGFCEVWPKPLDLSRVLARLDELLDAPPAPSPAPAPPPRDGIASVACAFVGPRFRLSF